jgi:hypothetical protein
MRDTDATITQTRAALVEADQSRERAEFVKEARRMGILPRQLKMRYKAGRHEQIRTVLSGYLVRDEDLAARHIARVDNHGFSVGLAPWVAYG